MANEGSIVTVDALDARLDLGDVTLVYITDAEDIPITNLSLRDNMDAARFGEVLLFSDSPWIVPGTRNLIWERMPGDGAQRERAIGAAMRVLWYNVPLHVKTKYFLVAQWDSWIINSARWTTEFLDYDYIGAPVADWAKKNGRPISEVGNGGFSIRSTRLACHVAANPNKYPLTYPRFEDRVLCRDHRAKLEKDGFTWAPLDLAARFSFEHVGDLKENPFAFHGISNFRNIMSKEQLAERFDMVGKSKRGALRFRIANGRW